MTNSFFSHLACSYCGTEYDKAEINTFCRKDNCHQPLLAKYHFPTDFDKKILRERSSTMWRYKELLPVEDSQNIVSLGEGMTPLLEVPQMAAKLGLKNLFLKEEGMNPTASFKARGLAMAISKARELGVSKCTIPTAGNAGSALSAYCAKAKMEAHVFMPKETPDVFKIECRAFGANLKIVDGTISDCANLMSLQNSGNQWFDVSTLKEPYRLEGKKTLGYEIAEQMNWETPDVLIYPTGGGTGLIGIWKAFQEMMELKWLKKVRTRMVAVQVEGCHPIVSAFENGSPSAKVFDHPATTIANGLRVPKAFGDRLILKALYESKGTAVSVRDEALKAGIEEIAAEEGLFVCPEGAATWVALKKLVDQNWIQADEKVVLLNTGSAYKYIENLS